MKSKSLFKAFMKHIQSHPDSFDKTIPSAIIYGTDEFKVDYKKKALKIDGLGWVPCEALLNTDDPDWLALFNMGDKVIMDLGRGDPFQVFKNGYTYKDRTFNMLPYCATETANTD